MSGIVGSRFNMRGSGLVGSLGTDGQVFTSSGAGAGAVFEAAAAGGKIGQVLSATKTDYFATVSTTLVDVTDVLVSITPAATSSKIWINISGTIGTDPTGNAYITIARDGTALISDIFDSQHTSTSYDYIFTVDYLDSPSSTSELSYTLQTKKDNGTTTINSRSGTPSDDRGQTTITVMEVLA